MPTQLDTYLASDLQGGDGIVGQSNLARSNIAANGLDDTR
jgi:hypothetical protein